MFPLKQDQISPGVYFNALKETRFKTNRISVNLLMPLDSQQASARAILPFLLRKGSADFPDMTLLNRELMRLYGASLDADVRKVGDNQVLNLSISYLDDAYALEQESIGVRAAEILVSILLRPNWQDGVFGAEDFQIEQQNLIDLIQSEINDKRYYTLNRLIQTMGEGEPFGVNKYGSVSAAKALTPELATRAYHDVLQNANVQIIFVGRADSQPVRQIFTQAFATVQRDHAVGIEHGVHPAPQEVREVTDRFQVVQSKMGLGFATSLTADSTRGAAMRLLTALYGGTPFSKLFLNVREKMSLCYYCAARFDRMKGILMVDCGVENQNIQKAREAILNQLDQIVQGEFTDQELENTRLSMNNSFKTVGDSPVSLEAWYLGQICYGSMATPEQEMAQIKQVTREDVIDVAKLISLDTVYILTGKEDTAHA